MVWLDFGDSEKTRPEGLIDATDQVTVTFTFALYLGQLFYTISPQYAIIWYGFVQRLSI